MQESRLQVLEIYFIVFFFFIFVQFHIFQAQPNIVERLVMQPCSDDKVKTSLLNRTRKDIYDLRTNTYKSAFYMSELHRDSLILSKVCKGNVTEYKIKSVTTEDDIHTTTITEGNHSKLSRDRLNRFRIACSCKDFKHRQPRTCKHGQYCLLRKLCFPLL